jgi:hypothetical protein
MSSRIWKRTLPVVLAAALALLPGIASAGMLGRDAGPALGLAGFRGPAELLARLWGAVVGVWEQVGATIDPHGGTGQGGGSIDPNGATTNGDGGGSIDPNG